VELFTICDGGGSSSGANDGSDDGDGSASGQPQTPKKDVDCEKLKALGVTSKGWDRMASSMIRTEGLAALGYNSLEFGFMNVGGDYYMGSHMIHADGRPGLSFPRIPIANNTGGYEYHSHPPGFDGLMSSGSHFSNDDRGFMSGWPAGNSLVGTVNGLWLMTSGSDIKLGGENWWNADCF
jgi:hypothetical protein